MFKIEWKNEPIGQEIKEKLKVLQDIYNIKNNTDLVEMLVIKDIAYQERLLKYQYGVTISDLIEEIKKDLPYGKIVK